jgi:signal recognition particle receptor subunit beta
MAFPLLNTILIIIISTVILIVLYKLLFGKNKKVKKNTLMIIGPSGSGKTTFFYYLLGQKNIQTVISMQINKVENFASKILSNINTYDIIDIPGSGYFKEKIIEFLPFSIIILVFIDSTQKSSIIQTAEYLYDLLNSDKYNEDIHLFICCNKQDGGFPKSKKMIENELNKEIENLIKIKQKNNLEEKEQIGTLFQMKGKFSFNMFSNVTFLETDMKSEYASVIKKLKDTLELEQ